MVQRKLSPQEQLIVDMLKQAMSTREIANVLSISPGTVRTHIYSALVKTGCKNRIELIIKRSV